MISRIVSLAAATLSLASPLFARTSDRPIRLEADAGEITRGILHAKLTFDVPPGPLTLYYPKWIPGNHRPSGEIENLTGIVMSAGGRSVPWERDTIDNYTFHLTVPRGAGPLEVRIDFVNAEASHALATVSWNQVVLYPAGVPARQIQVAARLVPPAGWETASALGSSKRSERVAVYPVVDLVTLVDSSVLMGANVARIALSDSVPREELVLACDSEEGLQVEAGTLGENGVMTDVHPDMPAARAGLAPGVKILGVDGRKYSFDALERAITLARSSRKPIELLVEDRDFYRLVTVDYHEGAKHPGLARFEGHRDWLTEILKPKVASAPDTRR